MMSKCLLQTCLLYCSKIVYNLNLPAENALLWIWPYLFLLSWAGQHFCLKFEITWCAISMK